MISWRQSIIRVHQRLFARRCFVPFHRGLYHFALRGLGVMNYEDFTVSGEQYLLSRILPAVTGCGPCTVVDAGANLGGYSKLVLQVNPMAQIFAFEPHPKAFAQLAAISNDRFHALNFALGAEEGSTTIYDCAAIDGSEHATLLRGVVERVYGDANLSEHVVARTRLDVAMRSLATHIHLLKIDTEGTELDVIRGCGRYLTESRIDLIQFEFNSMNVYSRCFLLDFQNALPGYRLFRVLQDGVIALWPYQAIDDEVFAFQNILAVRESLVPVVDRKHKG